MSPPENAAVAEAPAQRRAARDLMTAGPRTCSPFSTVTEAVLIFRDEDCGAVPVVEGDRPVGILTDRDVALATAYSSDLPERPVSEIMTRDVVSVSADASWEDVEAAFREHDVRRLLVTGENGELLGIIAWADLVPKLPDRDMGRVVSGVIGVDGRDTSEVAKREAPVAPSPPSESRPAKVDPKGKALGVMGFWSVLREAGREWVVDKVPRLGAALSFYSMLSLAPILLIAIAIAGFAFGADVARRHLLAQLGGLVGPEGRQAVETMLTHAHKPGAGVVSTVFGIITLLVGASGVVGQLQDALNTIWEVAPKPGRDLWGFLKDRFFSLAMVLGVGFLLLVSLVLSAFLSAVATSFSHMISQAAPALEVVDFVVSAAVITLLFAMIYKLLPDVEISWRDVWVGAAMTAVLFVIGKSLIGLYLGRSGLVSAYGAAGSLVVLLVWVYYSAQILFFGAEFTKAYADRFGSRIVPAPDAVPITEEARAEQGMPRPEFVAAEAKREQKV